MSAWGAGPFDNDGAQDWLAEFEDDPAGAVSAALDAIEEADDDVVEIALGQMVVAASEAVAASLGRQNTRLPSDVADALAAQARSVAELDGLSERAAAALDRIEGEASEIAEFWSERGAGDADRQAWLASIESVRRRLQ